MTEHEFTLADRIAKIRSINELHDLEHNAYISFSGGKDSTVLHYLIDEALPGNNIPRVFINTGIEYKLILQFVKEMASKDDRFIIWTVGKDIRKTLERVGYPFKSKEHAHKLCACKSGQHSKWVENYFRVNTINTFRQCPKKLMYQLEPSFTLKISDKCCYEFKKKPFHEYEKKSNRTIALTGMMRAESGQRLNLSCIVTSKGKVTRFHPLSIVSPEWEKWYIAHKSIKLALQVQAKWAAYTSATFEVVWWVIYVSQLDTLEQIAPTEKKRAEILWKPVFDEYRRIGYRLRKEDKSQPYLFEEFN